MLHLHFCLLVTVKLTIFFTINDTVQVVVHVWIVFFFSSSQKHLPLLNCIHLHKSVTL